MLLPGWEKDNAKLWNSQLICCSSMIAYEPTFQADKWSMMHLWQRIRVCINCKILFSGVSCTCKDQILISFSQTFQDIFGLQTWLHDVQKLHIPNHYWCNCITVNKPKYFRNRNGLKRWQIAHNIFPQISSLVRNTCIRNWHFWNHYFITPGLFKGLPGPIPFPGLSTSANVNGLLPGLSRVCTNTDVL